MKRKMYCLIVFVCVLVLSFPSLGSAAINRSLEIAPPPLIIQPFTSFDPDFKYLENGAANISNVENGMIILSGETNATQYVDTIGIKLIIQKWNGSEWEDFIVDNELTQSNEIDIYTSRQLNVPIGYYYRVHSIHWTIQNGTQEQGEQFSSYVLIQ
ncbi:MAG: hypothetical protein K0R57_2835 [Paenibacillaceae bacterium]|nr:hypothetical protein [Paenibacillaceae bacterium]